MCGNFAEISAFVRLSCVPVAWQTCVTDATWRSSQFKQTLFGVPDSRRNCAFCNTRTDYDERQAGELQTSLSGGGLRVLGRCDDAARIERLYATRTNSHNEAGHDD